MVPMHRYRLLLLFLCLAPMGHAGPPGSGDPAQLSPKAPGKPSLDGPNPYSEKQVDDVIRWAAEFSFVGLVLIGLEFGWKRFRRG